MSDWRPIDTAPKDGRQILVWSPERCTCVAWHKAQVFADDQSWMQPRWPSGWYDWNPEGSGGILLQPTHWMPLPQPPKGAKP